MRSNKMTTARDIALFIKEDNLPKIKTIIKKLKAENRYLKYDDRVIIAAALRDAILLNRLDIVRYFLIREEFDADSKASIDDKESGTRPLLYFAVKSQNLPIVKLLVEAHATIKNHENAVRSHVGMQTAVEIGDTAIAEYLLTNGAVANSIIEYSRLGWDRETYLGLAASRHNYAMADILLKFNASIIDALHFHNEHFRANDPKSPEKLENYRQSMRFLMDYAQGINLTSRVEWAKDFDNLQFLYDVDVTGYNFIGISLDGQPITKEILKSKNIIGYENAIYTLQDLDNLEKIQDPKRQSLIKRNLDTAFEKQGRLLDEKTGIVNLIPLGEAARVGDINAVRVRLQAGVSQNQIYEKSLPVLSALLNKDDAMVELFVNDSQFNKINIPALVVLAKQTQQDKLADFLHEHEDINQIDVDGNAPIHLAVENEDVARIKECIAKKANLNVLNKQGYLPLEMIAVKHSDHMSFDYRKPLSTSDLEIIRILLEAKADANGKRHDGSALNMAARTGSFEAMKLLMPVTLKKDYLDDIYVHHKWTKKALPWYVPLMFDSQSSADWLDILNLLLKEGADLNQPNVSGSTVLHRLMRYFSYDYKEKDFAENLKQLEFLLAHGADSKLRDENGYTALHVLFNQFVGFEESPHFIQVIDLFINQGFDVSDATLMRSRAGTSLLHMATVKNQIKVIEYLLEKKADINLTDHKGRTPLHCAAGGHPAVTKVLIEHGANLDAIDQEGLTPEQFSVASLEHDKKLYILDTEERRRNFVEPYNECHELLQAARQRTIEQKSEPATMIDAEESLKPMAISQEMIKPKQLDQPMQEDVDEEQALQLISDFIEKPSQDFKDEQELKNGVDRVIAWLNTPQRASAIMTIIKIHPFIPATFLLDELADKMKKLNCLDKLGLLFEKCADELITACVYNLHDLERCLKALPAYADKIVANILAQEGYVKNIFDKDQDPVGILNEVFEKNPIYQDQFIKCYNSYFSLLIKEDNLPAIKEMIKKFKTENKGYLKNVEQQIFAIAVREATFAYKIDIVRYFLSEINPEKMYLSTSRDVLYSPKIQKVDATPVDDNEKAQQCRVM